MFRSYLAIALRNLLNQHLYSFINLIGLAIGIVCCLLIGLFVVTLRYGPNVGVWVGFVSGLFIDVASPEDLGARALSLAVSSFVVGRAAEHVDVGSLIVQLILLAVMGLVDSTLYEAASHLTSPALAFGRLFGRHLPGLLYSLLVALILFRLFGRALLPRRVKWRDSP